MGHVMPVAYLCERVSVWEACKSAEDGYKALNIPYSNCLVHIFNTAKALHV